MTNASETIENVSRQLIETSANVFQQQCRGMDEVVQSALAEIDRLHEQLNSRAVELDARERCLNDREHDLNAQREQTDRIANVYEFQEARLSEVLDEVRGVREVVATVGDSNSEEDPRIGDLQNQIDVISRERETLAGQLQTSQTEVAKLEELMSEVHGLRESMTQQQSTADNLQGEVVQQLQSRLEQVESERDELRSQLHASQSEIAKLEELRSEVNGLRETVGQQQATTDNWQGEVVEQMQARVEQAESDREELKSQLAASLSELSKVEEIVSALTSTRSDLSELRTELANVAAQPTVNNEDEEDLASQIDDLENARTALEVELELVRGRAAELYETVELQKQAMEDQQQDMAEELIRLRSAVNRHTEMLESRSLSSAVSRRAETIVENEGEPAAEKRSADPVVSSVMNQFAKLQKDASNRRKRSK